MLRSTAAMGASLIGIGALLKGTEQPVQATNGQPLIVGQANSETTTTELDNTGNTSPAYYVTAVTGTAIQGLSSGAGSIAGVFLDSGSGSAGLYGSATSNGYGVIGAIGGSGIGVYGSSTGGDGVYGTSAGASTPGGVHGFSNATDGNGVIGEADSGTNAAGVWGISSQGYAGFFSGSVLVMGNLAVSGAKSAAVKAADGNLHRMYSLESPESWFEDFGTGTLAHGAAAVQLAPDFADLVDTSSYYVFLTPTGETSGLYVSGQSPSGFQVHEAHGGSSNAGFNYRVVAKRKDITAPRLEKMPPPPDKQPATPPPLPTAPTGRPSSV
jgi:hypothetical protein